MRSKKLPSTILVVFGVTGDLSHRYLLPAFSQIIKSDPELSDIRIVGISRRNVSADEVFGKYDKGLREKARMCQMDIAKPEDFELLKQELVETGKELKGKPQIIFYFSVPPVAVMPIVRCLGASGLNGPHVKLLVEKPFGVDVESARKLIESMKSCFKESQVYRIDHYLAKEMAQNIMVFLGSNTLFREVWSNQFIDSIEIIAAESIGMEGRGAFYDPTGALRDIVQSHLLQLAALTLMEPCSGVFEFDELPARRLAALENLLPPPADKLDQEAIRAQYEGYQDEVGNPGSDTETFVSLTLSSQDPRWEGVPIRMATGKQLDQKLTEIRIRFKKLDDSEANLLTLRIQPREGIELELWVKAPGYDRRLQKQSLSFNYQGSGRLPEAYEQVLVDAIHSNKSLFASSEEILTSWEVLEPIQKHWGMLGERGLKTYKPGSSIQQVIKN